MFKFPYKTLCIFCGLFLSVSSLLTGCSHSPEKASAEDTTNEDNITSQASDLAYSVTIGFRTYYGIYTGDIQNGLPHGHGKFTASDIETSEPVLTYSGDFSEGCFSGEGKLEYPDGSALIGSFSENAATGTCTFIDASKNRYIASYYENQPYGLVRCYSESDELQSFDWYYKQERISNLKELAVTADYSDLFHDAVSYINSVIRLSCTVQSVTETQTDCLLTLKDSEGEIYLAQYKNTSVSRFDQAVIPTLHTGDEIVLYGFYTGLDSFSCTDSNDNEISIGYTYPCLEPFYAELAGEQAFQLSEDKELSYEEIAQNPYMCSQFKVELTGTILSMYEGTHRYYIKFCETNKAGAATDHIYYISISKAKSVTVPAPGDSLTVKGVLNGNYKIWFTDRRFAERESKDYELYPLIKASTVKQL